MTPADSIPIAEGLFSETSDGPRLIGSLCPACGARAFPAAGYCRRCGEETEPTLLGPHGVIWSYTVMHYQMPPPFEVTEVPYAVAQVDLDEGLRIAGLLTSVDPKVLAVGTEVELAIEQIREDPEGRAVMTWKFTLVGEGGPR